MLVGMLVADKELMQCWNACWSLIGANKKVMQAHRDGAKLGKSPTGGWEYEVWLWRVPLICTTNHWPDPDLCPADRDWLEKQVVAVEIDHPVWEPAPKRGREETEA